MKTKIVFMLISMNIGGTEKALLNMISIMPQEKYDITILMLEKKGGFLDYIPPHVHVRTVEGYSRVKDKLNKPPKIVRLLSKALRDRSLILRHAAEQCALLEEKYDVAVAYAGPMDFISYFVDQKIQAKKKIQWIHFDITKVGFDTRFAAKTYARFDRICVVSEEGKRKFIQKFPDLAHKTERSNNIISPDTIVHMANQGEGFIDSFNGIRILTVGRLSYEKGQDLTIPVLAKLKKDGYNVRWYCVGEGSGRTQYEQLIKQYGLEEDYILLGARPNPYPFMKECDLYVQPSRHEGYCITLAEAKCFKKPIISTRFTGVKEHFTSDVIGSVVDAGDSEQIYDAIKHYAKRYSELIKES